MKSDRLGAPPQYLPDSIKGLDPQPLKPWQLRNDHLRGFMDYTNIKIAVPYLKYTVHMCHCYTLA